MAHFHILRKPLVHRILVNLKELEILTCTCMVVEWEEDQQNHCEISSS